tara:strand:+ start:30 stop:668 length:639 start_codon:yes stop_codon:yes gene_type:complete
MKQIGCFIFSILVCGFTHLQAVDYATEIQPIFDASCTGCHGVSGGLSLTSYANLMDGNSNNGPVVTAGDGANSLIIQKLRGTAGSQMPMSGCCLDDVTIDLIETWIDEGALEEETADIGKKDFLPARLILNPIYPNPFNPSATISWEQIKAENVNINIFNLKGELANEFSFTKRQPGFNSFSWHPENLPAGIYLIRLTGETFTVTQKAIYLK